LFATAASRCALSALAVGTLLTGLISAGPADAAADSPSPFTTSTPAAGGYVPVAAVRLGTATIGANATVSVTAGGHGAVPASGVEAVSVTFTVRPAAASGSLTAYSAVLGSAPSTTALVFTKGRWVSGAAVVGTNSGGAMRIVNHSTSTVQVIVDVAGYYRAGPAAQPGTFTPLASPARFVNGVFLAGNHATAVQVTGVGGVPSNIGTVVATVTATGPTAAGSLIAVRNGDPVPSTTNAQFTKGIPVSALIQLPLSASGKIAVLNKSTGQLKLYVDVIGYTVTGPPSSGSAFGVAGPTRILDTRTGLQGNPKGAVGAGHTLGVTAAGKGGIPSTNVVAVFGTLTVVSPTAGGSAVVYPSTRPATTNLQFPAGQSTSDAVMAPLSSGRFIIANTSTSGSAHFVFDISGYVLGANLAIPAAATSHYMQTVDTTKLGTAGTNDAVVDGTSSGAHIHLFHTGAQTTNVIKTPGVLLSNTTIRVPDAQVVAALHAYMNAYHAQNGALAATIVVGTNSDGYPSPDPNFAASNKGADWAVNVVGALRAVAPAGITVVGGNDIEAGFSGSLSDVKTWETSYLSHTTADLVYNGSLDACPDAFGTTADCQSVTGGHDATGLNSWKRADYVQLAYGLSPGRIKVLPQVYFSELPNQAMQWANVDLTSGRKLLFLGALTEHATGCGANCALSPDDGWATFWNALSAVPTAVPAAVTDLDVVS
jgi:hypothetical protein